MAVKPLIEAHDLLDDMTLHYGDVECVAGRQAYGPVHDFLGALKSCSGTLRTSLSDLETDRAERRKVLCANGRHPFPSRDGV